MSAEWISLPGFPGYEGTMSGRVRCWLPMGPRPPGAPRWMASPRELKARYVGLARKKGTSLGYYAYILTGDDRQRRTIYASQVARLAAGSKAPEPVMDAFDPRPEPPLVP